MLYPSTAAWISQYNQSRLIEGLDADVADGPSERLAREIQRARDYNDLLSSGAQVSPESNIPLGKGVTTGDIVYDDVLNAGTGAMGRIRIPSIDVDLPIYHGTSDEVLVKGVGHLAGTSLPVGGESQHSVLTAHRGLPSATLFDNLKDVALDDTFTIEVFGEVLTYRVIETETVLPDETQSLYPREQEDLITLVTCTPLGINTHRYLVTGERITPTPIGDIEAAGTPPTVPHFPWWILGVVGAFTVTIGYVWRDGYRHARAREQS